LRLTLPDAAGASITSPFFCFSFNIWQPPGPLLNCSVVLHAPQDDPDAGREQSAALFLLT
jgi:hypothetical protein